MKWKAEFLTVIRVPVEFATYVIYMHEPTATQLLVLELWKQRIMQSCPLWTFQMSEYRSVPWACHGEAWSYLLSLVGAESMHCNQGPRRRCCHHHPGPHVGRFWSHWGCNFESVLSSRTAFICSQLTHPAHLSFDLGPHWLEMRVGIGGEGNKMFCPHAPNECAGETRICISHTHSGDTVLLTWEPPFQEHISLLGIISSNR